MSLEAKLVLEKPLPRIVADNGQSYLRFHHSLEYIEIEQNYRSNRRFQSNYPIYQFAKMPSWTHLIRFEAVEDGRVHLGQLVDTSRDIGLDSVAGTAIQAFRINGDIFNGTVTKQILTVSKVG